MAFIRRLCFSRVIDIVGTISPGTIVDHIDHTTGIRFAQRQRDVVCQERS